MEKKTRGIRCNHAIQEPSRSVKTVVSTTLPEQNILTDNQQQLNNFPRWINVSHEFQAVLPQPCKEKQRPILDEWKQMVGAHKLLHCKTPVMETQMYRIAVWYAGWATSYLESSSRGPCFRDRECLLKRVLEGLAQRWHFTKDRLVRTSKWSLGRVVRLASTLSIVKWFASVRDRRPSLAQ
ncbi:hypothetical protein PMIN07_012628 [Paraphaeosphaeria minitans]